MSSRKEYALRQYKDYFDLLHDITKRMECTCRKRSPDDSLNPTVKRKGREETRAPYGEKMTLSGPF